MPLTHWFYRFFEFGIIQILFIQNTTLVLSFILIDKFTVWLLIIQLLTLIRIMTHTLSLYKYTAFHKAIQKERCDISSEIITVLSANVFQKNIKYPKFITLIDKYNPDVFLTMEPDGNWEKELSVLDKKYKYNVKVALNNTYSMHIYSKLKIINQSVHYFVADDLHSIEVKTRTADNFEFTFFTVLPPPPNPTEKGNSKERDGELLSIIKK